MKQSIMMIDFSVEDIFDYFRLKGGRVIYSDLVTHFKHALSNPETLAEARIAFKDYVNTLATVTTDEGKKFLVLRPKFMKKLMANSELEFSSSSSTSASSSPIVPPMTLTPPPTQTILPSSNVTSSSNSQSHLPNSNDTDDSQTTNCSAFNFKNIPNNTHHLNPQQQQQQHQNKPSIRQDQRDLLNQQTRYVSRGSVLPTINEINHLATNGEQHSKMNQDELDSQPPRPPPRKKNSFKIKSTESSSPLLSSKGNTTTAKQQNANSQNENKAENKTVKQEIQELAKTPGRVKEHAQILNKLVLNAEAKLTGSMNSMIHNKLRQASHSDTDSGSVQMIDPLKKQWIMACSECDFKRMLSLLEQNPKLCSYCDSISGYNALHWGAKFNRPEIIKLIAGNFRVDSNLKSFNGSTALHVAAQFKHEDIMRLLIYHYKADKEIRDNYGRKAHYYLPKKDDELKKLNGGGDGLNDGSNENHSTSEQTTKSTALSATENLKNNLRNKISHQSMLVRDTLRKSRVKFRRQKSMNEKSKKKS